ncbi:MAG TPA: hypothetical protein VM165_03925 [Planctomycetaceae bacterium]|nr:hypothetical protein [Planctomycetaceae bacterium]
MFADERDLRTSSFTELTRRQWLARTAIAVGGSAWTWGRGAAGQDAAAIAEYQRPFGPRAPWNLPVADLPPHELGTGLVTRLFRDAGGDRNQSFAITTDSHTYAVHDAKTATGPTAIKSYWPSNLVGKIPWNPLWKSPSGTDGGVIVLDAELGLEWDLSKAEYRNQLIKADAANLVTGDYRTREDGFLPSRGSGLPYLAMLVRPEEVELGKIEHALSMTIANVSTTEFAPPASKAAFTRGLRLGVPAGTRFSLRYTDEEIDKWLSKLPKKLSDRTRETARIIAVALRDYGWFITDSSPGNLLQFESNVTAEKKWAKLGFDTVKVLKDEYPRDLVNGLFTADRVVAYAPSDQYAEELRARATVVE